MYLVIDTWIWEKAQTSESPESLELLAKILRKCEYKIVCDPNGEIIEEYKKHIRELRYLFRAMVQKDKIVPRPKSSLKIKDFDRSDLKFVEVAITTPDKIIVSGNSDFFHLKERPEVKKLQVKILTPMEALNILNDEQNNK